MDDLAVRAGVVVGVVAYWYLHVSVYWRSVSWDDSVIYRLLKQLSRG